MNPGRREDGFIDHPFRSYLSPQRESGRKASGWKLGRRLLELSWTQAIVRSSDVVVFSLLKVGGWMNMWSRCVHSNNWKSG